MITGYGKYGFTEPPGLGTEADTGRNSRFTDEDIKEAKKNKKEKKEKKDKKRCKESTDSDGDSSQVCPMSL